jgi:hypothetical protein
MGLPRLLHGHLQLGLRTRFRLGMGCGSSSMPGRTLRARIFFDIFVYYLRNKRI